MSDANDDRLDRHHVELLAASAIPVDVAIAAGAQSVHTLGDLPQALRWARSVPGILFQHHPLEGVPVPQYRPDKPSDPNRKYLFPTEILVPLNVVPAMRDRLGAHRLVMLVEGTRQTLSGVAHAPENVLVVGMAGCWGWSRGGVAVPELDRLGIAGRPVVVALDADVATNPKVHDAAARLAEHLDVLGAGSVKFLMLPASGSVGLDDYLAAVTDPGAVLDRLIAKAGKLPRAPRRTAAPGALFDADGLRVAAAYDAITAEHHLALDVAGRVATYDDGVFRAGRVDAADFGAVVVGLLGDRFRSHHARTVEEYAVGRLKTAARVLPELAHPGLVNVANGMLNPLTGELTRHHPDLLSSVQLPIPWQPEAACPVFDRWVNEVAGALAEDLLEAAGLILETRPGRQRKALFLHGPSRSGKSTFLRLLEAIVGDAQRSAVTLHQLGSDTFAAADLSGSVLNCAADLSAGHLDDVSTFKMLTGDDPVRAQRKYGQPFTFKSRALFVFSANNIPTATEVSTAYLNRIRPVPFPASFEGHEDPSIEDKLLDELPGILVRLVEGYRRHVARGGYADTDATRAAAAQFARSSDRVRLFLAETCTATPDDWETRSAVWDAFVAWCQDNRRQPLGKHKFFDLIRTAGHADAIRNGTRGFGGITLRPTADWGEDDTPRVQKVQKVQKSPSSPTCEANREGETSSRVRGQWDESAPSAPEGDDPGFEDF